MGVLDEVKELKLYRMKRDQEDLHRLIEGFQNRMNPFDFQKSDNLCNISTGKKVSDAVRDDLLNIQTIGKKWREDLQTGCQNNPARFEKPIPRRKIKNFASDFVKIKPPILLKMQEITSSRDLFGRLYFLSMESNLDMKNVLSFFLPSVDIALSHLDGTPHSTEKYPLMHHLESLGEKIEPVYIDVTLVDVFFPQKPSRYA